MSRFEFDLALFEWLLTPEGQQLLAQASQIDLRPEQQLKTLAQLRQQHTREQAAIAYEMAVLRRHARGKFAHADRMYFTREALEQASSERVSAHRFGRLSNSALVCDLACSVGGDLLALAEQTHRSVFGVDRDSLRLAMAAANARALGVVERVSLLQADLEQFEPPLCEAIFFDPARREQGRRLLPAAYQPALHHIERWLPTTRSLAAKVAPGIQQSQLPLAARCETEFVSLDGELKEAVLWYGQVAQPGQRATLIQGHAVHTLHTQDASSSEELPVHPPGAFLYEPDGAILRAHLVESVGAWIGATQLDSEIAYLTSDQYTPTPFARCWRVLEWLPFQLKQLRAALRRRGAGAITVKKRGSPIDTDQLARELSGDGDWAGVVVLTQHLNRPIAILAEGPLQ